jgi:hypothetical protein
MEPGWLSVAGLRRVLIFFKLQMLGTATMSPVDLRQERGSAIDPSQCRIAG